MILDFINMAANLKVTARQGWINNLGIQKPESVADHTFLMAVIGMILSDLEKYNTEKILKIILLHDLAESLTGDITPNQISKKEKTTLENDAMKKILKNLPQSLQKQYKELWNEYQKNKSSEANLVHQIDKFEMALQAKIYSKRYSKDVKEFIQSAKDQINHPKILELLKEISDK